MRSTFKLLFYINRNKVKSDGTTAVLCRISIDGKKSAVTTGVYCKPGDWDSKKCEIKTARENNRLAAFRSRLEEAYGNLLRNQGVVTAELLKTTVSGANSVPEYLLQAGEVERERLRVRSKEINSTSTYRQSKTTQLNLRQFIESRGMKDIAFSDITEEFAEIVQGLSQEGAGTQERTREPLPVLAQPAHLHRRGPGNTKSQSDRGRGIREERNT